LGSVVASIRQGFLGTKTQVDLTTGFKHAHPWSLL